MSFDLGVWYPDRRLTHEQAGALYVSLCEGETAAVVPHPAVDAFYAELTARYPEIDDVADELLDDREHCPWSCSLDRSPGHVVMPCVWSQAENVERFVTALASKHGLATFNSQSGTITYPDESSTYPDESSPRQPHSRPWWRFW